jgi:hypothetical protein
MILIRHPLEDTILDQPVEPLGEDVARDPEAGLEIVEAPNAQEGIAKDEEAPPFPDDLETLGDRTVHVAEAGFLHGDNNTELHNGTHGAIVGASSPLEGETPCQ